MKLYIAGIYASNFERNSRAYHLLDDAEKGMHHRVTNILESYHYIDRQRYVDKIRKTGDRVFLDSGAFSAFTKGISVDLKQYCRYIKTNEDIIEKVDGILCASVLDGIGDPLKTYQNQLAMEKEGVRPLPCFHYGEDERYLEWYISKYEYITLGGMVPISTGQLFIWLDRLWSKYLTDGSGRPRVKVHGFGLTTPSLMKRYPWFSVDSSSWIRLGFSGNILFRDGRSFALSSQSPNRKMHYQHLNTISPAERQAVVATLAPYGLSLERAATIPYSRWAFNAGMFTIIGEDATMKDPKFILEQEGLF